MLIWAVPLFAQTPAAKIEPLAYLNSFQGDVRLEAKLQEKLKPGWKFFVGDTLIVGAASNAQLYVPQAGIVDIAENSKLQISNTTLLKTSTAHRLFRLLSGSLRGVFEKLLQPIDFENNTAVAGIRGTRLIVGSNSVAVLEGEVAVAKKDIPTATTLYSGDQLQTDESNKNWKGTAIPLSQLNKLDQRYDFHLATNQIPYILTHQQWAALLVKQLNYELPKGWNQYSADQYLELLSASGNSTANVDTYAAISDQGKMRFEQDKQGNAVLTAKDAPFTVGYDLAVPQSGNYSFEAGMVGSPQYWSIDGEPTVLSGSGYALTPSRVGPFNLKKGIYRLSVSVPKEGKLSNFTLIGPPFKGYAPSQGWKKDGVLKYQEMAVCLAKILGIGDEKKFNDENSYGDLVKQLQQRGFVFRNGNQPVLGEDGSLNSSLLKSRVVSEELPIKKRRKPATEDGNSEAVRSQVSPVLPGELINQ
jgi:hypothetical protein